MTCNIFRLVYEFSFPPKKTNRFILLEIHRTIYRVFFFPYKHRLHYTCIIRLVNGFFLMSNILRGFTILQWNQIIDITRTAVRNDE